MKCGNSGEWDIKRKNYCDDCPQKAAQVAYLDDDSKHGAGLKQLLEERMKNEGAKYDLSKLFTLVLEVAGTEDTPKSRMSAKGRKLLNIFLGERYKYDRLKDSQKPKK